jgi:hypothetical protein
MYHFGCHVIFLYNISLQKKENAFQGVSDLIWTLYDDKYFVLEHFYNLLYKYVLYWTMYLRLANNICIYNYVSKTFLGDILFLPLPSVRTNSSDIIVLVNICTVKVTRDDKISRYWEHTSPICISIMPTSVWQKLLWPAYFATMLPLFGI